MAFKSDCEKKNAISRVSFLSESEAWIAFHSLDSA